MRGQRPITFVPMCDLQVETQNPQVLTNLLRPVSAGLASLGHCTFRLEGPACAGSKNPWVDQTLPLSRLRARRLMVRPEDRYWVNPASSSPKWWPGCEHPGTPLRPARLRPTFQFVLRAFWAFKLRSLVTLTVLVLSRLRKRCQAFFAETRFAMRAAWVRAIQFWRPRP